jgi:hypothetical protein
MYTTSARSSRLSSHGCSPSRLVWSSGITRTLTNQPATMVAIPLIMLCKIIALVKYVLTSSPHSCVILIISPVTLIVEVPIIHVELGLLQVELPLIHCPGADSTDGILTLKKFIKILVKLWMCRTILLFLGLTIWAIHSNLDLLCALTEDSTGDT